MTESVRIGIDVGGTNTDAVLMQGKEVLTSAKTATSQDVRSGVVEAVTRLLERWGGDRKQINAVMIGTTQFVNAFVERRGLEAVAIFRVALPRGKGVPPLAGWPRDLVQSLGAHIYMVRGGAYYTGREYVPLDEDGLRQAAVGRGLLAEVAGAYSPEVRKEFRAVMRDNRARTFEALRQLRTARADLAAAEQAQPFDEAAVRQAMAAVRAATTNLQATVQDYLLAAMKNVNAKPAGGG